MYEKIKEKIQTSDYDFLRTERHLAPSGETKYTEDGAEIGSGIIMLGLGGSYAYGTNIATSDINLSVIQKEDLEREIDGESLER